MMNADEVHYSNMPCNGVVCIVMLPAVVFHGIRVASHTAAAGAMGSRLTGRRLPVAG